MTWTQERLNRYHLVGWLVCACLVLKPLLLLGHVLTDAHCLRFEIGESVVVLQDELAHLGIFPHEHEHGTHAHGDHCHDHGEHESDEAGSHDHHDHCPHPLVEHFETLTGDPADIRQHAAPKLIFLQLALGASPLPEPRAPTEWRYRWMGRRKTPIWRVDHGPPCPRGPPVV